MTISRSQIGSQMKGGTMYKKKPVKKKALGGVLGMLANKGKPMPMGILPMLAKKSGAKAPGMLGLAGLAAGKMKSGGKVTRGDGACKRGKTRGRIT